MKASTKKNSIRGKDYYTALTHIKEVEKLTWHSLGNNLGRDTENTTMKRKNGNRKVQTSMFFMQYAIQTSFSKTGVNNALLRRE